MEMRNRWSCLGTLWAATLLALTLVVWVPGSANAGGPSQSCDAGNYCLSQFAFTSGSSATKMEYGWRQAVSLTNSTSNLDSPDRRYNWLGCPSSTRTNDTFSTSGACVGGNVQSIRNRDNINGKTLRFYSWVSEGRGGWWYEVTNVTWSFSGWKQTVNQKTEMWALRRD